MPPRSPDSGLEYILRRQLRSGQRTPALYFASLFIVKYEIGEVILECDGGRHKFAYVCDLHHSGHQAKIFRVLARAFRTSSLAVEMAGTLRAGGKLIDIDVIAMNARIHETPKILSTNLWRR
jgi:hypothetical protein